MAIKKVNALEEGFVTNYSNDDTMLLGFTNGDIEKFNAVMEKYNFLDEQALIRFAISILLANEGNDVVIKQNGQYQSVVPADSYTRKESQDGQ